MRSIAVILTIVTVIALTASLKFNSDPLALLGFATGTGVFLVTGIEIFVRKNV